MRFGEWVENLFTKHKLMRRGVLSWIMLMITTTSLYLFFRGDMTEHEAAVVMRLIEMLAVGTALYTWGRTKEGD